MVADVQPPMTTVMKWSNRNGQTNILIKGWRWFGLSVSNIDGMNFWLARISFPTAIGLP